MRFDCKFRPSFPHLETLKKILENSTLSRYVIKKKKKKKKKPTRPNFRFWSGEGKIHKWLVTFCEQCSLPFKEVEIIHGVKTFSWSCKNRALFGEYLCQCGLVGIILALHVVELKMDLILLPPREFLNTM